ncbi:MULTISPECIES: MarR family winged helix-turn-helix transcriptional regulator [unclassified Brachybacterium]|uniref:MarR family winged helix-turn-helix transcriptional regulator n=1 Tax=unclassified Brachybacterium TaxID=2623841 RepID=UPI000C807028|nr:MULTISPECIES: MarR family winged helix-turn-helix transcriptional regulator [unclassified Brachybacterium]PMC74412.1 MarR family transcriptional regulator [Brachybacterium sp. UMB0905]
MPSTPPTRSAPVGPAAAPRDEVDGILAGWHQARPDLDVTPLAVLSRISRLARYLETARREAFADAGLEGWEFDMLSALRRSGEDALSPGALMRETLVTSGTMTTRIDKLAARDLVRKNRSAQDRRAVEVRLLPEGVARVDAAMERLLAAERELLEPLSADSSAQLANLLRSLLLTFEADNGDG